MTACTGADLPLFRKDAGFYAPPLSHGGVVIRAKNAGDLQRVRFQSARRGAARQSRKDNRGKDADDGKDADNLDQREARVTAKRCYGTSW